VTWATSMPILLFLGLSVLDLGPMYATDRQTSDTHHCLMPLLWGHNNNDDDDNRIHIATYGRNFMLTTMHYVAARLCTTSTAHIYLDVSQHSIYTYKLCV